MADTAASVLARLKNKSKKNGRSYQLCLQLFCQEEFLRRLGEIKIFRKTCPERRAVYLLGYRF